MDILEQERVALIALQQAEQVGSKTALILLEHFGNARAVFQASKSDLLTALYDQLNAQNKKIADYLPQARQRLWDQAAEVLVQTRAIGGYVIQWMDPDYPSLLRHIPYPPLTLFIKGNLDFSEVYSYIGIVGTRQNSQYGYDTTRKIVQELRGAPNCIVSGLAEGIDAIAHQAALDNEMPTIGVLGHGIERIFPPKNKALAEKMLENGAIVSEFLPYSAGRRENFAIRNRLVAGLCSTLVVVESAARGGSLITAQFAQEFNREVLAVPGRVGDVLSAGCNALIAENKAALWQPNSWEKEGAATIHPPLQADNPLHQQLLNVLQKNQCTIDLLYIHLPDWGEAQIAAVLLELEFAGRVKKLPGNQYGII